MGSIYQDVLSSNIEHVKAESSLNFALTKSNTIPWKTFPDATMPSLSSAGAGKRKSGKE